MNFLVEEWGGKYQSQDISAKKGTGVHDLLEKVLLEAEMLDLKANPTARQPVLSLNRRWTRDAVMWLLCWWQTVR